MIQIRLCLLALLVASCRGEEHTRNTDGQRPFVVQGSLFHNHGTTLFHSARAFHDEHGRYPRSVEELLEAGVLKRLPKDPWGHDYIIEARPRGRIDIYSAGADGRRRTRDDMRCLGLIKFTEFPDEPFDPAQFFYDFVPVEDHIQTLASAADVDERVSAALAMHGIYLGCATGGYTSHELPEPSRLDLVALVASLGVSRRAEVLVSCLARALDDESPDVREAAASSLWRIGPDAVAAIPGLEKALEDPVEEVRAMAKRALASIR